jgi:hypothetical protein
LRGGGAWAHAAMETLVVRRTAQPAGDAWAGWRNAPFRPCPG